MKNHVIACSVALVGAIACVVLGVGVHLGKLRLDQSVIRVAAIAELLALAVAIFLWFKKGGKGKSGSKKSQPNGKKGTKKQPKKPQPKKKTVKKN